MLAAAGWGALAASSLVLGALIGLARPWPRKPIGLVLGFGAGALIGLTGDFAGDSLAGSAGLVLAGEGGLVLIAVASVLLSG